MKKAHAIVYRAQEKYGWIWVTPGTPTHEIPFFPEWDNPTFHKVHCGPYYFKASGLRAIENFLEFPENHTDWDTIDSFSFGLYNGRYEPLITFYVGVRQCKVLFSVPLLF